ncbi:MAG: glycosyltransferase, partial [candidate division Zixibacteria bacterium]|nr:glycosyltransferase [candidate division Zixibacteria bacterium]
MPEAKKKNRSRNKGARRSRSHQVATAAAGDRRLDRLLTAVRTHPDDVPTRLDLAEHYWRSDQTKKIAEALEGLESQYPFADKATRGRYNVLAAFGHAHRNQPVEAEKVARRGLEEFPNALDFQFVLAFVHLSLREYDQVIEAARAFLESCRKTKGLVHRPPFCSTADNIAQVYNFLGAAYAETNRVEEAEENYRRSIETDPGDHRPYLNLIRLLRGVNRPNEAQAVNERGLAVCRQVQELRMLSASHRKKATVSACMMVKNEEELLPGALDSVRDWVDEIIVVDTGSTDKTVEIAESYGAKVFHQPWEGNFSKHRNYTVELATCDWVFIIDADERFDQSDVPPLLRLINNPENEIISINVFNRYRGSNDLVTSSNSVRFWRKSLDLRYEGIVHNALDIPNDSVITQAPISLEHVGYDLTPEKMEAKFHRTMDLLQKQLDENPRNGDAWFNIAQLLRGRLEENSHELAEEALAAAKRAVEYTSADSTKDRGTHIMALNHVAWIANLKRDYRMAEEYALKALELKPDYLDP